MCGSFRDTWQNGLFYSKQIAYTFHNLLFSICSESVDVPSQILQYKNVNDILIYMFYILFCLYIYFDIQKQNS